MDNQIRTEESDGKMEGNSERTTNSKYVVLAVAVAAVAVLMSMCKLYEEAKASKKGM